MWFRNLHFLHVNTGQPNLEALEAALKPLEFVGCGRLDRHHAGFVPPLTGCDRLAVATGDRIWLTLQIQEKILPGRVVSEALTKRMQEIEHKEARRIGRKEKQTLKDQIVDELLPQAFSKLKRISAMLGDGWLLIDAGTVGTAEVLISLLLQAVPGLKLSRPDAEESPTSRMADLLLTTNQDGQLFQVDNSCELRGPGTPQSKARFAASNLLSPEVSAHLAAGMRPASLGLVWQDKLSLVFKEDWRIGRIRFLDLVQDQVTESDAEDQRAMEQATLTIQGAEMVEMLSDLMKWLNKQ